jgi:curli biogenesis system outer membrane secretion channel CsgG
MTIKFPVLMMLALLSAASTASAQSANRSASGVPAAPARVETLAPEREAISRCRAHCDSVTVSGPHATAPRQSTAERQARQSHCAKRMA